MSDIATTDAAPESNASSMVSDMAAMGGEAAESQPGSDAGETAAPGAGEPELNLDGPGEEEITEPFSPDDEAPMEDEPEAAQVEAQAEARPAEELPEGVRAGKDRNGKEGFWIKPERFKEVYEPARLLVREASESIGEPLTKEAIEARDRAYLGQERLYGDLLSGDPEAQSRVISHFIQAAENAVETGEVAQNPMVGFARGLYTALQQANPQAYAVLRHQAACDLVDEMYAEAAQTENKSLWLSAQHFDKTLGRSFKLEAEMQTLAGEGDPAAGLRAENARLQAQLNSRSRGEQAAQLSSFLGDVNAAIDQQAVTDITEAALEPVKASYEKFPEAWKAITDQVHAKIREAFRSDARLKSRVNILRDAARRAATAQKRQEIGSQIVQLYQNHAKLTADAVRPGILKEAAQRVKARSDATHQRRQLAQQQRSPGQGTSVSRPLVDPKKIPDTITSPDQMLKMFSV